MYKYGRLHIIQRPKGSGTIHRDGYKFITHNNIRKPEHRIIMENFLQRPLLRTEHIHHINKNKLDNRIENLMILSNAEHLKLHPIKKREPTIAQRKHHSDIMKILWDSGRYNNRKTHRKPS
jgi:hypothetical protein